MRSIGGREEHTPRADGVSVYYPFALVELLDYRELNGREDGEVSLAFSDEDGCRVTVRIRRLLIAALVVRLSAPPDPSTAD